MNNTLLLKYFSEAFATFCLIFVGTGAIIVNSIYGGLGHLGICLSFGFIVAVMIYGFGHISGAHMNPAVTIGFWIAARLDLKEVFSYIIAQILGGVLASLVLKVIFLNQLGMPINLGMTIPSGSLLQSFVLEWIFTFILMFVVMSVSSNDRLQGDMAGLVIGFLVTVLAFVGGPVSGASMNPARSIAPALVSGNWHAQWIYILAPISAALVAVWSYQNLELLSLKKSK